MAQTPTHEGLSASSSRVEELVGERETPRLNEQVG